MTVRGVVRVPGDKSISHRALILGALAVGESHISGILQSADVQSTAAVLRALGVAIPDLSPSFSFFGRGLQGLRAPGAPLDAGNSGTTVRLMSGVLAAHPFTSTFTGDSSLSRRPMKRISEPLIAMGARVEFARDDGLPMTIHGGRLAGIAWNTRAASAQTKSAILLAALSSGVQATVMESARSRDHTERMLTSLGGSIKLGDNTVSISPVETIAPLELAVPGDPSSAAYFVALALLGAQTEVKLPQVCINPTRTGFIETLMGAAGRIEYLERTAIAGDTVATISARSSLLRDITVEPSQIPAMIDELPLLACVAAAANITLDVSGAAELRVKESDRIATVTGNLRSIGVNATETADGFRVVGTRSSLRGSVVTHGDHRIAMAFGVLSALPGNDISIDDPDCVAVSYPAFWEDLKSMRE
ncbi:MAG: 3-phosphoshikimate 1-carboxyvinyltransferase [Gemmatimonadaceae bacterium]